MANRSTPVPNVPEGTSPSKNIQRANDTAWHAEKGYQDAAGALADAHNKKPVDVGGGKK